MAYKVFISHAGADWPVVESVAAHLRAAGLEPLVDREEIDLGESFLAFMNQALRSAHHCLLLWSQAAARSAWVRAEWEAAFHRTITEGQGFLLIGLLDDCPVPALLAPRLCVPLFPDLATGLAPLITLCLRDAQIEKVGERPVCAARVSRQPPAGGIPVYVSSELFGRTFPWKLDSGWPVALAVQHLVQVLELPVQLEHQGRIGVRFHYGLAKGERTLAPSATLANQDVHADDLLWLTTRVEPFAAVPPAAGAAASVTYRDSVEPLRQGAPAARALMARALALGLAP